MSLSAPPIGRQRDFGAWVAEADKRELDVTGHAAARARLGVVAILFLLSIALGGAIGDPLNGTLFDLFGGYRPLFLMMSIYTGLAFVAVLLVPRGAGEASTA